MVNLFLWFTRLLPGKSGVYFRKALYSYFWGHRSFIIPENVTISGFRNIKVGQNLRLCPDVKVFCSNGKLIFGNNFFANYNCFFSSEGALISFGNNCQLGPNVTIINRNHNYDDRNTPIIEQGYNSKDILIGNDVWIGANTVILPGVRIGDGAVIGAGSIVSRDVEPYSVIACNPAAKIKDR